MLERLNGKEEHMLRLRNLLGKWPIILCLGVLLCAADGLMRMGRGKPQPAPQPTVIAQSIPQPIGTTPPVSTPTNLAQSATAQVIDASNAFGFRLYQQLSRHDLGKNLFISPLSISAALAMTYNGAKGQTQTEMAKTLGWSSLELSDLNAGYQDVFQQLQPDNRWTSVELANGLVAQKDYSFRKDFLHRCQDNYHAELATVDFLRREPAARKQINSWCEQKTHGKIKQLLTDPLPALTRLVLINSLYFKDYWKDPFGPHLTTDQPFTCQDGRTKTVPMMEQIEDHPYFATEQFQAIRLPYSQNNYSMDIFLPAKGVDLATFSKQLTPTHWRDWQQQFKVRTGTIHLPRFKADYHLDLKDALKQLGMSSAFSEADFSGMTRNPDGLFISNVFHQTTLEVYEKGTEAAAETAILLPACAKPMTDPFIMTVDHPFFFAIRAQNGTLLFIGSIADPQALEVTYEKRPESHFPLNKYKSRPG